MKTAKPREWGPDIIYASIYKKMNSLCRAEASATHVVLDPDTDIEIRYVKESAYMELKADLENKQEDFEALNEQNKLLFLEAEKLAEALEKISQEQDMKPARYCKEFAKAALTSWQRYLSQDKEKR